MTVIGLTGSIGMGKSTVAEMFRDEGVPVFNADAVVHALQGPNGRLVAPIEIAFPGTTGANGVDRALLGQRVLNDVSALRRLEAIVHPAVAQERAAFAIVNKGAPILVYDIPLLLEKGGAAVVDVVVVVSAPPDVRRMRVLGRDGMTSEKLDRIVALQMTDADKIALADHVIDTGTSLAATRVQVRELIACLGNRKSG